MRTEWVVTEIIAIVIECAAMFYFIDSRISSKERTSKWFSVSAFVIFASINALFTFAELPFMEIVMMVFLTLFLVVAKNGNVFNKLFCVLLTMAIAIGASLISAQLTATAMKTPFDEVMEDGESVRIVAIALSKMFQMSAFWFFAKRHTILRLTSKTPSVILLLEALLNLGCLSLLYILCLYANISRSSGIIITIVTIGLLVTTALVFLIFEIFVREENTHLELLSQVQRLEVEGNFYKQIDAMYTDMRQWRHDYRNHILSLTAILNEGQIEQAKEYLRQMTDEPSMTEEALNSPNTVLNAVVNAKLTYARSKNIDITLTAIYPDRLPVSDVDLCAIIGNLLDNAIEACERIKNDKRFIGISITTKKKMLMIGIRNSTESVVIKNGNYITSKQGGFHGMGIKFIDEIVEKYQGSTHRECADGVFLTQIMLPIKEERHG